MKKPMVYYHNAGYFVIKFDSVAERDVVIQSGPYMLNNRPTMLREWKADFDFNEEVLKTIPLWIKLPNLPLNCWGMDSLSRIGSGLGKPVYADDCTTKVDRIT